MMIPVRPDYAVALSWMKGNAPLNSRKKDKWQKIEWFNIKKKAGKGQGEVDRLLEFFDQV